MEYNIPLLIDQNNEPIGLFSVNTTEGPVVIVFTNTPRLEEFLEATSAVVRLDGKKVGTASFDADSMEEVVAKLLEADPSIKGSKFVPDGSPIFDDAVAFFKSHI